MEKRLLSAGLGILPPWMVAAVRSLQKATQYCPCTSTAGWRPCPGEGTSSVLLQPWRQGARHNQPSKLLVAIRIREASCKSPWVLPACGSRYIRLFLCGKVVVFSVTKINWLQLFARSYSFLKFHGK